MNKHYLKGLCDAMNFSVAKTADGLAKKCMNFIFGCKSKAAKKGGRESGGGGQKSPTALRTAVNEAVLTGNE